MPPSRRLLLASVTTIACALGAAPGRGAPPPVGDPCAPITGEPAPFHVNTNRTGLLDLRFFLADGAPVTYVECVGGRAQALGVRSAPGQAITSLLGAAPWSCDRLVRHFAAYVIRPDGSVSRGLTSVRTASCARRFDVEAPLRAQRGRPVRVRVVDRWGVGGIATRLCFAAPRDGGRRCAPLRLAPGKATATRTLRPDARGRWTVELQVRGYRVRSPVAVGVRAVAPRPAPRVLATGDSTMQGIESSLADDLGASALVQSDVRPGVGLSRADWLSLARAQVAAGHPRAVVYSLGAAEGFPMTPPGGAEHECCDGAWTAEYARRAQEIFRVYRQGGRGRVFVLTIPAPKAEARRPIVAAVNAALLAAARRVGGVTVLRMDLLFSPDGYRETIRDGGREVDVREPDGVHLNASGTAIAARVAAAAVRRVL